MKAMTLDSRGVVKSVEKGRAVLPFFEENMNVCDEGAFPLFLTVFMAGALLIDAKGVAL